MGCCFWDAVALVGRGAALERPGFYRGPKPTFLSPTCTRDRFLISSKDLQRISLSCGVMELRRELY